MSERPLDARLVGGGLIALGALWLLLAVGILPSGGLARFLDLWPLLLIGGGLDLIGPERIERLVLGLPYTAVALALMALLAILYPATGLGGTLTSEAVRLERGGAERADVRLAPGAAALDLSSRSGDELILGGEIRDRARVAVSTQGNRVRDVELQRRGGPARGAVWSLELSERIPVRLELDGGSGSAQLELRRIDLAELRADLGSGPTTITLPLGGPERVRAQIEAGSGPLRTTAPDGARIDLEVDASSGPFDLVVGRGSDLTLVLDAGSGPVDLDLPDAAAVRVEVADRGSGPLRLAGWLTRIDGDPDDDEGVWQSATYRDGAQPAIVIRLDDAGSGPITVR